MANDLFDSTDTVQGLTSQMSRLDTITAQFGRSLSRALSAGIIQGKGFDEILRGLGERLIDISLKAAFKPLESGISSMLGGLVRGVTGLFTGGTFGTSSMLSGLFGGSGTSGGSMFGNAAGLSSAGGVTVNMAVTTPDAESSGVPKPRSVRPGPRCFARPTQPLRGVSWQFQRFTRSGFRSISRWVRAVDPSAGPRSSPQRRGERSATRAGPIPAGKYDAGYGVRSITKLAEVVTFFEERRGAVARLSFS